MTIRQRLLKSMYPLLLKITRLAGKNNKTMKDEKSIPPPQSLYPLEVALNDGKIHTLEEFRGKKLLLVNTASDCGYTAQYKGLQQLYEQYQQQLTIIGFPANDFKEQEKGSDAAIETFCQVNYGVRFPLARKSSVVKGASQHPVFSWLSDTSKNGWNGKPPGWNFTKYLVDEEGKLTHCFEPSVEPLSEEVINAIEKT